jgi:hypothetical protein
MVISRLAAATVVVGLVLTACSDEGPTPVALGVDARAFDDAEALLDHLRESGVTCGDGRSFDPIENVAPDGVRYPPPDALVCSGPPDLYVLVYDTVDDRVEALDHGEVNLNLCSFAQNDRPDPEGWVSVVGANWRVAAPGEDTPLDEVLASFGGDVATQPISCEFRA